MLSKINALWLQTAKHNSNSQKLLLSLGTLLLYIILFALFYPQQNISITSFTALPVALIAWFYGLRIGVIIGLLSIGLNTVLLHIVGYSGFGVVVDAGGGSIFIATLVIALTIGKISDEYHKLKRAHAKLTQEHELLTITVDTIPIEIFAKDRESRFIFANAPTRVKLNATRHEDYRGKSDLDYYDNNREIAKYYIEGEQEIIKTGKPILDEEYSRIDPQGNIFWGLSNKIPYFDKDGNIMGIVGINQRITERKEMEETLRQSEASLLMALEAASMRTWHWNLLTNKVTAKGVDLPGFVRTDYQITYEQFLEGIHPDDRTSLKQAFRNVIENGVAYDVEYRLITADGDISWIASKGNVERDSDQSPIAINGVSFDITKQKQADQQRMELALERERIQLLANFITQASHEFKTPLSIISTSTYLLENIEDRERQKSYYIKINEQVKNITLLIENLITLSKLDSGGVIPMETIDLNQLLSDIYKSKQISHIAHSIISILDLSENLIIVSGDVDYLEQALTHIWDNAIHHTPPNEQITIRSVIVDSTAIVEIIDKGNGIHNDDLPHIFNRFYRADKSGSTRGFGLGLPIAKVIIERLDGQIEATSELGKGSCFRITLPLIKRTKSTT